MATTKVPTCVASAVTPDADPRRPTATATSLASSLPPGPPEWTATTTAQAATTPANSCGTSREPLASKAANDGSLESLMAGLATYEYKVQKRKRGRPRKYEDLTEEERKAKRAVDNRQAAKRSYYRRINKMAELEDKVSGAIFPFARSVACPSQPR